MPRKIIKIITTIILILLGIVVVILGIQQSDFSKIKKYDKKDSSLPENMMSSTKQKIADKQRHNRGVRLKGNNMASLGDFNFNIARGKTLIANITLKYKSNKEDTSWFGDDENIENEIIKKSVFLRDAAINTMMGNTRAEANSEKIRRELKRELNKNLRCGEIEEVYFNKFIIQ